MNRRTIVTFTLALSLFVPLPRPAVCAPQTTEFIGSHFHDPSEKAAEYYSRGMKSKRKADAEKDPEKKGKLLLKAKDDLIRSVAYESSYDALLALGQVDLGLSDPQAAQGACARALVFKPDDAEARACVDQAQAAMPKGRPAPK